MGSFTPAVSCLHSTRSTTLSACLLPTSFLPRLGGITQDTEVQCLEHAGPEKRAELGALTA